MDQIELIKKIRLGLLEYAAAEFPPGFVSNVIPDVEILCTLVLNDLETRKVEDTLSALAETIGDQIKTISKLRHGPEYDLAQAGIDPRSFRITKLEINWPYQTGHHREVRIEAIGN
jgi:hypothetical protein